MGEKKGKALVMKLLDDLLDGDASDQSNDQKKTSGNPNEPPAKAPPHREGLPSASLDAPTDLEISDVVKVSEESETGNQPEESILDLDTHGREPVTTAKTDATLKLNESKILQQSVVKLDKTVATKVSQRPDATRSGKIDVPEAKSTVGRFAPLRSGGFSSATEAALATSENLRIAQTRILDLEQEISRLRTDNEQLAAAGETLRRRADELLAQTTALQGKMERTVETKEHEIDILRQSQIKKDKELSISRLKIDELEMRLSTNIQKIRVRERELENRLELVKMESTALVRNKDEIILDLKRQVDQLNLELENYRNKGQELNKQLGDRQEILRRTVKALRLALSMLEGDEDLGPQVSAQKKVK